MGFALPHSPELVAVNPSSVRPGLKLAGRGLPHVHAAVAANPDQPRRLWLGRCAELFKCPKVPRVGAKLLDRWAHALCSGPRSQIIGFAPSSRLCTIAV